MKTRQDKVNADFQALIQGLIQVVSTEQALRQALQSRLEGLERIANPVAAATGCAIIHNPTALAVKEH